MGLLSRLAVKRGVTFAMLYFALVGIGFFALRGLKLDLFPDLKFPIVGIVNSYTGVNPEEIENLVTRTIEGAVASVKNVKRINSTSKQGNSLTIVQLEWGTDIDKSMIDMREKIDIIKKMLPEEARQPFLFAFDPSLQPIFLFGISGPGNSRKLRTFIEKRIKPLLERLPGVASATVMGGRKREIQVMVNPRKLRAYGLSMAQLVQALRADNLQVASGTLNQGRRELALRTVGTFQNVKQIEKVVVGMKGRPVPKPVYLSEVARVVDSHAEQSRLIRSLGKPGLMVMIQKRSDGNTVQTARRVLKALPSIKRQLPAGVKLQTLFNQSDFITMSLSNLNSSAMQAFFLAVLVLLFFLRSFRTSLIIAVSIPVSVITTFSVMYAFDITLNVISMAGLALAVGMLVDNSIVVLENVFRHFEEGADPWEAAMKGSQEVGLAIMASTLTTLFVFIPVLFVPGLAGMLFRDMVITICFSLTASLIVAVTLIPLMASRILKPPPRDENGNVVKQKPVFWMRWLENAYVATLKWSLKYRKTTLMIGVASFFASIAIAGLVKTEFIPKADDSMIMMRYEQSPGSSLQETIKTAQYMESVIRKKFGSMLEAVVVEAGIGEGFIALFGQGSHAGLVRARLKPIGKRPLHKTQIQSILRKEFEKIPGLKFNFEGGPAFADGGDIEVKIFGHDLRVAKKLVEQIKVQVKLIQGVGDVKTSMEQGRPELKITLKRDRLRRLGLNAAMVGTTVSTAFKGQVATLFRQGDNEFNILVRLQKRFRASPEHLRKLLIATPTGKTVPLESIADIRYALSPVKIEREDQQRMAKVMISLASRDMGGVIERIRKMMDTKMVLPNNFYYKIGGQAEDFIASFQMMGIAFLVSVMLVYMVMASQFESLFEPFVILFSIPLSIVGVILALLVTDTSLSVMGLVGIIVLVGIVVNNAIVLIDFVKQHREKYNTPVIDACIEGGRVRLRPILMTAATTICGMIPLALGLGEGAENWAALGRVVIGGLTTSTFLTLLIVPTLYTSFTLFFEKRRAKREAKRAAKLAAQQS